MTLLQIIIMLPLVIVLVAMTANIVRNIARAWLDHRVKLALLDQLERKPGLLNSMDALEELLDTTPADAETQDQIDYLLTGAALAAIGLVCALLGALFAGRQAAGIYIGGVICVALGFMLVMVGVATRFLARTPVERKTLSWWRRLLLGQSDRDPD